MSNTRIRKVKCTKDDKIVIEFEKSVRDGYDKYRFTSEESAAPSFYDAMKALVIHSVALCELPESYVKRVTMLGVTFTYKGDDEIMGATMSAVMELYHSDSVIPLNTPHKPSIPYEANATEPYGDKALPEKCVEALWELDRQAQLYINSERGQITLNFDQVVESTEPLDEEIPPEEEHDEMIKDIPLDTNIINFPSAANSDFSYV